MSLIDVARLADVSIATASRVLSGSDHPVSNHTRQRVLNAAAQLKYYPNSVARALVTQKTNIIGVIVGDIDDPYFSAIVRGIEDMAREQGYLAFVCNSDREPDTELNYVKVLRDYHVDGIIFAGGGLTDEAYLGELEPFLLTLLERGVQIVGIGLHRFIPTRVDIDNAEATREMTEYLLDLGHREIAYIRGPQVLTTSSIRFNAFTSTLEHHGISFSSECMLQGEFTIDSGYEATTYLLESGAQPTAIFAANDQMAIGSILAIQQRGLEVPRELSVVGFDDIAGARYVHPPLTTIRVPMYDLGIAAVESLMELVEGREVISPRILHHTFVLRESSGPPPTGNQITPRSIS